MSYLLDANIFLEGILLQEMAEDVKSLLGNKWGLPLYISDFSLHSIGYILFRRQKYEAWQELLDDAIDRLGIRILHLSTTELKALSDLVQRYTLDFDDAYQYTIAETHNLTIISYDTDFNRTPRRAVTPAMVLRRIEQPLPDQEIDTK